MALKQVFKSQVISCRYIFGDEGPSKGKVAPFVNFMYLTDVPEEIAELNKQIELTPHGLIYRDSEFMETDTDVDPMSELKAKIIAEYEANKQRALDAAKNTSTSISSGVNPLTSAMTNEGNIPVVNVQETKPSVVAAGEGSNDKEAALAALRAKVASKEPGAAAQSNSK